MESQITTVITIGLSAISAIGTGTVILYLRNLKLDVNRANDRVDVQSQEVKELILAQAACKKDCDRNFVSKEDWLRETGYSRDQQTEQTKMLAKIEGKMEAMNKIPEILGIFAKEFAKEIATQLKDNKNV